MDTQTNDFGDYTLNQTSPSCSTGCTCNLRLVETVPAGYTAVSASEPSAYGSVVSATEIKYSWLTSGSYPNNDFALSGPAVITYQQGWRYNYFAGEKRIAVRGAGHLDASQNGLFFLLSNHLNSTAITMDQNGVKLAELRYMPWGETRYTSGSTPTDRRYTGQREFAELGLYHYGARWYDPYITQFTQPDSIVPDPYNALDWNRYSYARYNPIKYNDPSGHCAGDPRDSKNEDLACWKYYKTIQEKFPNVDLYNPYIWERKELRIIARALRIARSAFGGQAGFAKAVGNFTITQNDPALSGAGAHGMAPPWGNTVILHSDIFNDAGYAIFTTLHEIGHIFDFHNSGMNPDNYKSQRFVKKYAPGCDTGPFGCVNEKSSYASLNKLFGGGSSGWNVQGTSWYGELSSIDDFADSFAAYAMLNVNMVPIRDVDQGRKDLIRIIIRQATR